MKITKKLFAYVLLAAFLLQVVIILYNHYTGFVELSGAAEFAVRVAIGTAFAFIAALILVVGDIFLINKLNEHYSWQNKLTPRLVTEAVSSILIGAFSGIIITLIVNLISPYKDPLKEILIFNALIAVVINIIFVTILEAIIHYKRSKELKILSEQLEKDNALIRLDILKSQLNPHFLFNSLNVLSSLINKDKEKAQTFIDEFSSIYRYILEVIDKPVVNFRDELEFGKSYLYLQQIRFEGGMNFDINISSDKLDYFVPPLALQTLLENCFKHNKAVENAPLNIKIYDEHNFLVVENNYQPKISSQSSGFGLENLTKRYELISSEIPKFNLMNDKFVAKIPFIIE
jgi:sensor histidine kinase YesM